MLRKTSMVAASGSAPRRAGPVTIALRVLFLAALVPATIWVGQRLTVGPDRAYGEIFRDLSEPLLLLQRHGAVGGKPHSWRLSRINNNLIPYRVDRFEGRVSVLFDALERGALAIGLPRSVRLRMGSQPRVPRSGDAIGPHMPEMTPAFRVEWGQGGVLGQVYAPGARAETGQTQPLALPALPEGIGTPAGGLLATVGLSEGRANASTLLTFWFDDAVDWQALVPSGDQDAPGRDLPGVPRYPGLRRWYTIEEGEGPRSVVGVYTGPGRSHAIASFYRQRMPQFGWTAKPLTGRRPVGRSEGEILVYVATGMECVIAVSRAHDANQVRLVVTARFDHQRG
jgi:hypothetical protein